MNISYWTKAYSMAVLLREAILEKTGVRLLLTNKLDTTNINYGRSDVISRHNSGDFVRMCVNKREFSNMMHTAGFVDCPKFLTGTPTIFPCIVRERLSSFSAFGITCYANLEAYNLANPSRSFWWTPFTRCEYELRVHVLGGEFAKVYKKEPIETESEFPIRNSYNLYHYSNKSGFKSWNKLMELQERLRPILTGSFYALDVGWDTVNKRYFIFEANTAPGITAATAGLYADYLIGKLGLTLKESTDGVRRTEEVTQGGSIN